MEKREERGITADLEGKVVGFESNNMITLVKTEDGIAKMDVNTDWDMPRLKIGDHILVEDGGIYIKNGKIVTIVWDFIWINGILFRNPDKE
jgi:hypothetical protein